MSIKEEEMLEEMIGHVLYVQNTFSRFGSNEAWEKI